MKPKIIFTDKALPLIMEALGFSSDKEGFITNAIDNKRVFALDGKEIKMSDLSGFHKSGLIRLAS